MSPNIFIWRHRTWLRLVHVKACCLMAPSHYLIQDWIIIDGSCGICPWANAQEMLMIFMIGVSSKATNLGLNPIIVLSHYFVTCMRQWLIIWVCHRKPVLKYSILFHLYYSQSYSSKWHYVNYGNHLSQRLTLTLLAFSKEELFSPHVPLHGAHMHLYSSSQWRHS